MATYEVTFKAVIEVPFGSTRDEVTDEARLLISNPSYEAFEVECFDPDDEADNGDEFNLLVDEYLKKNVEGDPSWGEMIDAQAYAEEQIRSKSRLCVNCSQDISEYAPGLTYCAACADEGAEGVCQDFHAITKVINDCLEEVDE